MVTVAVMGIAIYSERKNKNMAVMNMIEIEKDAVKKAMQKRGYTNAEVAAELSYGAETSLYNALKRGRMPEAKFKKLVALLHVPAEDLIKKPEEPKPEPKPVQERLNLDGCIELTEIAEALNAILNLLIAIYNRMERNEDNGSDL